MRQSIDKTVLLTDEQFYYLFSRFKSTSCKKGQAIISAVDKVYCEYFVLSGCLKDFFYQLENQDLDCKTNIEVLCLSNSNNFELNCAKCFFRWRTNKGFVIYQKRLLSFINNEAKKFYEELLSLYLQLLNYDS